MHPIDENSPLFGWTRERLVESSAEFLILLTAIDETFAQTVHSRSSYAASEVLWNARFAPMFRNVEGAMELDISRLHAVTPAEFPGRRRRLMVFAVTDFASKNRMPLRYHETFSRHQVSPASVRSRETFRLRLRLPGR